jgi:hypothetical protein
MRPNLQAADNGPIGDPGARSADMNGRDMPHHAWSRELHEASLARRKGIKGELRLSGESVAPTAPQPDTRPSGWTARIAAMLPTLRRMVLGAA